MYVESTGRCVEARGPDAIGNGIALSGTVHWMFDTGLISMSDELDILVPQQVKTWRACGG